MDYKMSVENADESNTLDYQIRMRNKSAVHGFLSITQLDSSVIRSGEVISKVWFTRNAD